MKDKLTDIMNRALNDLADLPNSQMATVAEHFEMMIACAEENAITVIDTPPVASVEVASVAVVGQMIRAAIDPLTASVDELIAHVAGFAGTRSAR